MMKTLILALLLLPVVGYAELTGPHYIEDPGGFAREFYLYLPEELPANAPLIYSLHGWGGSGLGVAWGDANFSSLAEEYKFLVCYPTALIDGDGGSSGLTSWNTNGLSDVDFLVALTQYLVEEFELDASKVFSTGFSYGAEMSHHLARCQSSPVFAAIAPVGGAIFEYMDICAPSFETSVFVLHGTADDVVFYEGGDFPGYGPYMSAPEAVSEWVEFNSCSFSESNTIPDPSGGVAGSVEVEKYLNEGDLTQVWFYSIIDLDHRWPTPGNCAIDASEEIWSFFMEVMESTTHLEEVDKITSSKKLIRITDVLGSKVIPNAHSLVFYIYDDGSVEKKMILAQ